MTPTITWSNPANIIPGTELSSTQLNANASVLGNFTYNPASGTILSVGAHTLHADFTPNDTTNYTTASKDVTINVFNNSTPPIVTNGLVVYYNGNLSESSLVDLSGNNNIGYATNVTSGTNQLTGTNYINFNGVNSSVNISNNEKTNISSPISIEFIGSIHEFDLYRALVSKYDDRNTTGWYTGCSAHPPYQQVRFALCVRNETSGTNFMDGDKSVDWLVADQVYHIVVTYDNITARIYINGVNSGNHTWNTPIIGNPKNITIGSGSGIPNGNCSMYVFRLYNRVLSPDEVWQNYISDRPRYKITPTITWSNPADITYGTPLSSTQLNANASIPGNFSL